MNDFLLAFSRLLPNTIFVDTCFILSLHPHFPGAILHTVQTTWTKVNLSPKCTQESFNSLPPYFSFSTPPQLSREILSSFDTSLSAQKAATRCKEKPVLGMTYYFERRLYNLRDDSFVESLPHRKTQQNLLNSQMPNRLIFVN